MSAATVAAVARITGGRTATSDAAAGVAAAASAGAFGGASTARAPRGIRSVGEVANDGTLSPVADTESGELGPFG